MYKMNKFERMALRAKIVLLILGVAVIVYLMSLV